MTESHYPSTQQFITEQAAQKRWVLTLMTAAVVFVVGIAATLILFFPQLSINVVFIVSLATLFLIMLPVAVWNKPELGFYLIIFGVMFFETDPGEAKFTNVKVPTMRVPFFWNLSTIGKLYGTRALEPLIFSFAEALMVLTALTWLIRAVVKRDFRLERGEFFIGVLLYTLMVIFGYIRGATTGGNAIIALWEVRAQFYFILAYLMGCNMVRDRKQILAILWIMVLCIGTKGILGTIRFLTTGMVINDQGVMAHEESLFMDLLYFILIISWLGNVNKKIQIVSALVVPTALVAQLANNRRAGIAAFLVAFIPLIPMLWVIMLQRRKAIAAFMIGFTLLSMVYLSAAWNSSAAWALPARAIKSNSDPNSRDAGSNAYRDLEDTNLQMTRDSSPFIGIGYGKPFAMVIAMPDIKYNFRQIMPHNSLLWIWMRLGHLGYFAFWVMVALALIRGPQILKETQDPLLQTMGCIAIVTVIMVVTFGKFDLQLVNYRSMIMMGAFMGILSVLPKIYARHLAEQEGSLGR